MKHKHTELLPENPGFEPFELENDRRLLWAICAGFAAVIGVIVFVF